MVNGENASVGIDKIISRLRMNGVGEIKCQEVDKAFRLAQSIHIDQFRESGEPYISHPLNVAVNLLDMGVYDPDTISAALLHDTIEDAEIEFTKEDIANYINPTVAELVDGVTKMRRMNYTSKSAHNEANTRKIIMGLTKDVRIIIIKLADRLHNMRTLKYKKREKQIENARETLQVFVPLALLIGAYKVKGELEDLSLYYLQPDKYREIDDRLKEFKIKKQQYLDEVEARIKEILSMNNIPHEIILRVKNIYGVYNDIKNGYKMENIFDLYYLKILVDEIEDCYRVLYHIHSNYIPLNGRFKDYIRNPKTNLYQSLHTTVSLQSPSTDILLPNRTIVLPRTSPARRSGIEEILKFKIRTRDMDAVAANGLSSYWTMANGMTIEETQRALNGIPFEQRLKELNHIFTDDSAFCKRVGPELLEDQIYAYSYYGDTIVLPRGATALDFLTQVYPETFGHATGAIVNSREVPLDETLATYDVVRMKTEGTPDRSNWLDYATTSAAKQKVKQLMSR